MGFTLTDILLFGGAKESDADNAAFVIMRRNILRWGAIGGYVSIVVHGVAPLVLPDAIANTLSYVKAFGGTKQHNLPIGYTLLDYIESAGTQYIDLGYKGNENTKVEVKFKYHTATSATGSGRIFGSRTNATSNAFAIGSSSGIVSATGNKAFWCYDAQSFFVIDNPTFPVSDWQTVVFSATEHTLNGVSYGDDYNVVEFETPQNLKLFGFDNNGTMGYGQIDVAYCKLWDNGVLIRDLVPCKNASNVIGMYDLANDQFYTNDGTGDFVAGPNTVPTPTAPMDIVCNNGVLGMCHQSGLPLGYTLLEYIESDGGQYIDLGLKLTQDDSAEIEFELTTSQATKYVFGARTLDASSNNISLFFASTANRIVVDFNNSDYSTYRAGPTALTTGVKYKVLLSKDDRGVYDGSTTVVENLTACADTIETAGNAVLFNGFYSGGVPSAGYGFTGRVYSCKVANKRDLIPCKDSNNVLGMYDTLSGQFFTNAGMGTFTAGPEISDPVVGIRAGGPVETISAHATGYNGGTATCEDLLSVGDYTDVQEVIGGEIVRKVGILALTGYESWQVATGTGFVQFYTSSTAGVIANNVSLVSTIAPYGCTVTNRTQYDFGCYSGSTGNLCFQMQGSATLTTVDAWVTYLRNQYAAGTPVIVVYPLATPTTESVAGQTLQVTDGDNIVEITQAGMTGLELEVQYTAAVSLTVQEVEDVNPDPNVVVIIS